MEYVLNFIAALLFLASLRIMQASRADVKTLLKERNELERENYRLQCKNDHLVNRLNVYVNDNNKLRSKVCLELETK